MNTDATIKTSNGILPAAVGTDLARQEAELNAMSDTANGTQPEPPEQPNEDKSFVIATEAAPDADEGISYADPDNFISRWVWVKCPYPGFEKLEIEINAYFNPKWPIKTMLTTGEVEKIFRGVRGFPFEDKQPWDLDYPGAPILIGWLSNQALQDAVVAYAGDPTSGTE